MFENPEHAFGGTRPMLSLIEQIYAAAQQPELWESVLHAISDTIGGESTAFFATFPGSQTPDILALAKTNPAAWNEFAQYYAGINPMMARGEAVLDPDEMWASHKLFTDAEFEKTEFYNDYFRRYDMHHTAAIRISLEGTPANLTCQRPKARGEFGLQADTVYQTLRPHLQRALTLHGQLTKMQSSILGMETALDAHEHAVFGLNREGRVIFSNRQAESIARTADALSLANGRLSAVSSAQNHRLQTLLSGAVGAGLAVNSGSSLLLNRRSGKKPLRVTVTPFVSQLPGSSAQLAALIFVSDPEARPQSRSAILRSLYALTPTEARVADSLLHGLETREIAEALGLTLETIRFHIKRILSKTGTRRQTELMRLMLSLPLHNTAPARRHEESPLHV
ncbi:MAG TPA: helix-turn-helix transcriptional regulator [Acidobacteriaceae bacterium]